MGKIDIHVFGHHERDDMIERLQKKLNIPANNIHYDDRPDKGYVWPVAKKAWCAQVPDDATHRIVLADDSEVCSNFEAICSQMICAHPDAIISLFPFDYMNKMPCIDSAMTPYFECRTLSGVGILMPVKYIEPCCKYIKDTFDDQCHDDFGIGQYLFENRIETLTTIPATVQHIGDDSLVFPGAPIRRTVYYSSEPTAEWSCRTVACLHEKEWFFSNNGHRRANNADFYLKYRV